MLNLLGQNEFQPQNRLCHSPVAVPPARLVAPAERFDPQLGVLWCMPQLWQLKQAK